MKVRKNLTKLSPQERADFIAAVLEVKQNSSGNFPSILFPTDPDRTRYDDYVLTHRRAMSAALFVEGQSWAHNGPAFCPWHRVLIREFEKDLQKVDVDVTIPYWDWSVDQATNALPWTNDFLGGDGAIDPASPDQPGIVTTGPFAHDPNAPWSWTVKVKDNVEPDELIRGFGRNDTALDLSSINGSRGQNFVLSRGHYDGVFHLSDWRDYMGFRFFLEGALHNLVHRWAGGNMGTGSSPNDPVFWLHHCNIDRLWAVWQQLHPNAKPFMPDDSGAAARGHNLNDELIYGVPGSVPWAGIDKPAMVVSHRSPAGGGVWYDSDPPDIEGPAILEFADTPQHQMVESPLNFRVSSPNPITIEFSGNPSAGFQTTARGTQVVVPEGENHTTQLWLAYTAPDAPSAITDGSVNLRASATLGDGRSWNYSWTVTLKANSIAGTPEIASLDQPLADDQSGLLFPSSSLG